MSTRGQGSSLGFLPQPLPSQYIVTTPLKKRGATSSGSLADSKVLQRGLITTPPLSTVQTDAQRDPIKKRIRFPHTDMSNHIAFEATPIIITKHPIAQPVWSLCSRRRALYGALICNDTGGHDVELAHPSKPHSVVGSATGKVWVYTKFPGGEDAFSCPSAPVIPLPRHRSYSRYSSRRRPSLGHNEARCKLPRGESIYRRAGFRVDESGGPRYHCPLEQVFMSHKILLFDPNETVTSPSVAAVSSPSTAVSSTSPIRRNPFVSHLALQNERQIRRRWPTMTRARLNSTSRSVAGSDGAQISGVLPGGTLNGRRYQYLGGVKDGRRHGWGRLSDDQHLLLEGTWRHGRLDGWFIAYHEYYVEMGFRSAFYRMGVIILGDVMATIVPYATQLEVDDYRGTDFHASGPLSNVAFFSQSVGRASGRRRNSPFPEGVLFNQTNGGRRRSADCESPRRAKGFSIDFVNRSCPTVPFGERPPRPWQKRGMDHGDGAEAQRRRSDTFRDVEEDRNDDIVDNIIFPGYSPQSREGSIFGDTASEGDHKRRSHTNRSLRLIQSADLRSGETAPWSFADSEAQSRPTATCRKHLEILTASGFTARQSENLDMREDHQADGHDSNSPDRKAKGLLTYYDPEVTTSGGVHAAHRQLRKESYHSYSEDCHESLRRGADARVKQAPFHDASGTMIFTLDGETFGGEVLASGTSNIPSRHKCRWTHKVTTAVADHTHLRRESPSLQARVRSISLGDWTTGGWPLERPAVLDRPTCAFDDDGTRYSSPISEGSRMAGLSSFPSAFVESESQSHRTMTPECPHIARRFRRANSYPRVDHEFWKHPPFEALSALVSRETAEAPATCRDRANPSMRYELLSSGPPLRGMDITRWDVNHVCQFLMCLGAFPAVPIFRAAAISGDKMAALSPKDLVDMGLNDYMCAKFVLTALRYLWGLLDWNEPLLKPLWLMHHPMITKVPRIAKEYCEYRRKIGCGGHASVWKGYLTDVITSNPSTLADSTPSNQNLSIPVAYKIFLSTRRRQQKLNLQAYLQRISSYKSRRLSPPSGLLLRIPSPSSLLPRLGGMASSDSGRSRDGASSYGHEAVDGASITYSKLDGTAAQERRDDAAAAESQEASSLASRNMTSFVKTFRWWIKRTLSPRSAEEAASTQLPSITIATATTSGVPDAAAPAVPSAFPDTVVASPSTSTCVSSSNRLTSPKLEPAKKEQHHQKPAQVKKSASLKIRDFELNVMQSLPYHPNVLRLIGYGEITDSLPMLVLEFCSGGALADHIVPEGRSPASALRSRYEWPDIVRIFADVAEGMAHLHANGFYHRDIKPSNFLIGADGCAKVADMGVVKSYRVGNPSAFFLTAYGNAYYAAPEVLRGEGFWPQSDVYSFGISFWEALTGKLVHEGQSRAEVISRVATNTVSISAPAHLSPDLKSLLEDLLQFDWRERPTFKQVAARFKAVEAKNQETLLTSVQCFMGL